jgi:hypothetical protein
VKNCANSRGEKSGGTGEKKKKKKKKLLLFLPAQAPSRSSWPTLSEVPPLGEGARRRHRFRQRGEGGGGAMMMYGEKKSPTPRLFNGSRGELEPLRDETKNPPDFPRHHQMYIEKEREYNLSTPSIYNITV